ncbi:Heat shock protein GrpE [hydrothermal vent metagenome]|uniref:Heat shock protein GrpE n=1 Tax=hydrothermal vent metagenome TaxID=652676 RepID=A0A3B0RHJ2_9ZZZZ
MSDEQNTEQPEAIPEAEAAPISEAERFAEMEQQLSAAKDQTLRLAAELENVRKRSQKAEADARRYGVSRFAEDMLSVADNLSRALANVPAEARAEASERMNQLVEGVDLTQTSLLSALERHGIKQLDPKGEKFDHHLHQAVAHIPSAEITTGHICEVIQPGYTIGDRTLRAAMVVVSTGAPAVAPANESPVADPDAKPGSTIDTKA